MLKYLVPNISKEHHSREAGSLRGLRGLIPKTDGLIMQPNSPVPSCLTLNSYLDSLSLHSPSQCPVDLMRQSTTHWEKFPAHSQMSVSAV